MCVIGDAGVRAWRRSADKPREAVAVHRRGRRPALDPLRAVVLERLSPRTFGQKALKRH